MKAPVSNADGGKVLFCGRADMILLRMVSSAEEMGGLQAEWAQQADQPCGDGQCNWQLLELVCMLQHLAHIKY